MPAVKPRLKVGGLYEIELKNGESLFGYTVYKRNGDEYVVGYDGVDGGDDVRLKVNIKNIKSAEEVDD